MTYLVSYIYGAHTIHPVVRASVVHEAKAHRRGHNMPEQLYQQESKNSGHTVVISLYILYPKKLSKAVGSTTVNRQKKADARLVFATVPSSSLLMLLQCCRCCRSIPESWR